MEDGFHRLLGIGFPAHAGIDPTLMRSSTAIRRFPRPRGDRPVMQTPQDQFDRVSPPTRG